MKRKKLWNTLFAASMGAMLSLSALQPVWAEEASETAKVSEAVNTEGARKEVQEGETVIVLSDQGVTVNGEEISQDASEAVYAGAEIIYYKEGQDATYGAGDEEDGHSEEEAAEHTVITITRPGTYRVSGSISKGQIAVDLGEGAEEDETAVVNLILDNADITCTVAPAIVVYQAYECGSDEVESASMDVDTENAGFHLILADDSVNTVNGSHVAKIYQEGTTQEEVDAGEAKKAWKLDAAVESLVSLTIEGEESGNGTLSVTSDNEGIETSLHLTINGGVIDVNSADDAINASEDSVSVLTINGGTILCNSGLGDEGDGMDSNGWIVMNGGFVNAYANPDSQDSGVDSDLGIYINGGTLLASGNMYDEVSADSAQQFMVLSFSQQEAAEQTLLLKNSNEEAVAAFYAENSYQTLVYSSPELAEGDYTLYRASSVTGTQAGTIYTEITDYEEGVQLQYNASAASGMGGRGGMGGMGFGGGQQPGAGEGRELPEGMEEGEMPELPEGAEAGEMPELPEGAEAGEMPELPEGAESGEMPELPEGAEDGEMPELPEGVEAGETSELPEGAEDGEAPELPEGAGQGEIPELPEGDLPEDGEGEQQEGLEAGSRGMQNGGNGGFGGSTEEELTTIFALSADSYGFYQISETGESV